MTKNTKNRIGWLLGFAAVGGVGYLLGRYAAPLPICPSSTADAGRTDIAKLASNVRSTCEIIQPLLSQIEVAYADQRISVDEAMRLVRQVSRLT